MTDPSNLAQVEAKECPDVLRSRVIAAIYSGAKGSLNIFEILIPSAWCILA